MSRIIVFDLKNRSSGEIHGVVKRGWVISDGGNTEISLSADEASKPWVQLGHMVYVAHEKLPAWAGVIDTPWSAMPPVKLTAYDLPYLLGLRSPEKAVTISGKVGELARQLLENANADEDLFVRLGRIDPRSSFRKFEVEQKPVWEQLQKVVSDAGMELMFRPEIEENNQLVIYVDIQTQFGTDAGFFLQDGEKGNCRVVEAKVDGEIWNQVIGTTKESTKGSRKTIGPLINRGSINKYRMRSTVEVFDSEDDSQLEEDTTSFLNSYKEPILTMQIEVVERSVDDDTFRRLRLGNVGQLRATRLVLPGGRRGWDGYVRILAMQYDEARNTVVMNAGGML